MGMEHIAAIGLLFHACVCLPAFVGMRARTTGRACVFVCMRP